MHISLPLCQKVWALHPQSPCFSAPTTECRYVPGCGTGLSSLFCDDMNNRKCEVPQYLSPVVEVHWSGRKLM